MFLANSFKEKLRKSYLEGEAEEASTTETHKYIPKKQIIGSYFLLDNLINQIHHYQQLQI